MTPEQLLAAEVIAEERRRAPLLVAEASLADAARCLRRAARLPTRHRDEIIALCDLAELLGRQVLREAAGT